MAKKNNTTETTTRNCTIIKHLATLHTSPSGITREVNLLTWEGEQFKDEKGNPIPYLDIREWSPDRKPYKGIGLNPEQTMLLIEALAPSFEAYLKGKAKAEEIEQDKPKAKPRTKRAAASAK